MELTVDQMLQQGVAAHNAGNLQEAERFYRAILQVQPKHPDANHNLGLIAVSMNQSGVALPLFKRAIDVNPNREQFWLSYIDALITERQFDNAKRAIKKGKKKGVTKEKLKTLTRKLASVKVGNILVEAPSQVEIQKLINHYQNGQYGDAATLAISITEQFPEHQLGWKVLGAVFGQTGRTSEALIANQRAVQLETQDAEAHSNLGNTLKELGRLEEAEASCRQAIKLKSDFAGAHCNLGVTLKELGKLEESEASFRQAIALKPDFAEAYSNLGGALLGLSRLEEAEASYKEAIALKPHYAAAHSNLGNTLKELGKLDEAEASYRQAVAMKPDYAPAHNNLGITLKELGRLEESESSWRQAIALKSDFVEAHYNLGNMLQVVGRLEEAEASFKEAIALKPDYAEAYSNLGITLQELGRLEEAEASYKEAIALKPDYADAYWNLSLTLNLEGNLAKGFELYEWRFKKKEILVEAPRIAFCWDGKQSLKGKRFVIYDEQGLGDIIQFTRYLPLMVQKGAIVSFKVKHSLHKLFGTLSENIALITELPNDDELDFEVPLMSLPHLFETTLATVPASTPYLYADEAKIKTWAAKLVKDKFRIGICWQGSKGKVDFGRSFPLSLYKDISEIPDVELISLHKGEGEGQHSGITFDVTTFGKELDDGPYAFLDTAAVMMNCDLIITSDTAVAHLAGALGRQTWVALKHIPDWRWMLQTPKTPWYPTLTLYRQKVSGDWATVFATIEQDLCSLLNQKGY